MSETEFARAQRYWMENCDMKDRITALESKLQIAIETLEKIEKTSFDNHPRSLASEALQKIKEKK